eukprot:scaffold46044_cov21-Tisochrysis_lutea.AAC.1
MELASLANFWGRAPKTLHTASSATPSSRFLSFLAQLALALSSYSSTHCMERSLLDVTFARDACFVEQPLSAKLALTTMTSRHYRPTLFIVFLSSTSCEAHSCEAPQADGNQDWLDALYSSNVSLLAYVICVHPFLAGLTRCSPMTTSRASCSHATPSACTTVMRARSMWTSRRSNSTT